MTDYRARLETVARRAADIAAAREPGARGWDQLVYHERECLIGEVRSQAAIIAALKDAPAAD